MKRFVGLLMMALAASTAPDVASAETSALQESAEVLFDHAWTEASAAVADIALVEHPETHPMNDLNTVYERLEQVSVRLIELRPPPELLGFHFMVLPTLQEITAATRAIVDARNGGDEAELTASVGWLEKALAGFSAALKQATAER